MGSIFESEKFCFCFTLRTGCIVSGILFLLLGLLRSLVEIGMAVPNLRYHPTFNHNGGIFAYDIEPSLAMVFSGFLLYGTFKEKSLYVFAGAIYIIVLVCRNSTSIALRIISGAIHEIHAMAILNQIFELIVMLLIHLYLLLNVYNFYKELNKREIGQTFQRMRSRTSLSFENERLS